MAKTKPAKRFANFWTQKRKGKDDHRIQKVRVFFFQSWYFWGLGFGRWRVPGFLEPHPFPRLVSITWASFSTNRNGWPSWTKNFKTFRPPSVWGARWVWWIRMTPRHVKNAKWMVILLWDIYIFTHVVSSSIGNIHPNSQQLPKSWFFSKNRGTKCTILFNMTVSATQQKNKSYSPPGSLSPMAAPMHTTSGWDFCWHKSTCFQGQQKQIPKRMFFLTWRERKLVALDNVWQLVLIFCIFKLRGNHRFVWANFTGKSSQNDLQI